MEFKKIFLAALFPAVLFAQGNIYKIEKQGKYSAVYSGYNLMITATASGNYSISSFQYKHKPYMYFAGLTCYEKGVKAPCNELKTPAGKCTELRAESKDGKIFWQHKFQWRNMNVIRTIESGSYPGFKITYDVEVTRDFTLDRLYFSFRMPQNNGYIRTGYVKNGVIQFRPVKKSEWFGIQRNRDIPYITFSGDTVKEGVMIMAGDMKSWNMLPTTLLYATTSKCYWTTEFMYRFPKEQKKGNKFSLSAYVMMVNSENVAAEAQELYLQLKDQIK